MLNPVVNRRLLSSKSSLKTVGSGYRWSIDTRETQNGQADLIGVVKMRGENRVICVIVNHCGEVTTHAMPAIVTMRTTFYTQERAVWIRIVAAVVDTRWSAG